MQLVALITLFAYCPFPHAVHDDEPYVLILPATQSLHSLVVPSTFKYSPASHAVQTVKPFFDVVPLAQVSHDVFLPCSVLYVSAAHSMHFFSSSLSVVVVEYLPGEQSLQPALLPTPSADEYFPCGHDWHAVVSSDCFCLSPCFPFPQAKHSVLLVPLL